MSIWQGFLRWSLPGQVVLLLALLLLVSQQGSGDEGAGLFPPAPRAEHVLGQSRTVRVGYPIVDQLRYGGIDRGSVVLSEGRLAGARAHRFPLAALPTEVPLTTRDGRTYRFHLESASGERVTLTLIDVSGP